MSVIEVERIIERRRAMRVDEGARAYVTERQPKSPVPGMHEFLSPLFGRMLNVSENGILLEMEEPLQPGRLVDVGLEIEGARFKLPGVVARVCRPRHAPPVHIGIRFVGLDENARRSLRKITQAHELIPHLN